MDLQLLNCKINVPLILLLVMMMMIIIIIKTTILEFRNCLECQTIENMRNINKQFISPT